MRDETSSRCVIKNFSGRHSLDRVTKNHFLNDFDAFRKIKGRNRIEIILFERSGFDNFRFLTEHFPYKKHP